jgi:hypothetical protein
MHSGVFTGVLLYAFMKTRVTPISQTKTQALARVLASVTLGYTRVCMGTVPPERLSVLASPFFAAYASPDEYRVENERLPWMLLATPGERRRGRALGGYCGPVWLDHELYRHNDAGELRWTWRRTCDEMSQLYAEEVPA